ncbi:MAG: roadblock/LC7 domain-containing protein [Anaerolineae bacterium]|nr:roadblock/LC7 domain-containing protein [Anaerolineae bacterium]
MLNKLFGHKPHAQIPVSALERTLREVARRLPDLRWAAIVSVNGLIQEMYDPFGKAERDRVAAMTAAAFSLGERISNELRHGQMTYSVIAGDEGLFVVHCIGREHTLAVSLPIETEIGAAISALTQAVTALVTAYYADET